jgi:hypothetical protein
MLCKWILKVVKVSLLCSSQLALMPTSSAGQPGCAGCCFVNNFFMITCCWLQYSAAEEVRDTHELISTGR